MAKTWSSHGPSNGSSWILINVPRNLRCQISPCWLNPVAPFPWNCQNMALLWPKHGAHMVLQVGSTWILVIVSCQSSHSWVYPVAPFPRNGPEYGPLWLKHGPSNWFFLNLNQCAKGCSMPNFTLLGVSCSPLSRYGQNMALFWPKNGPHMVLKIGSS